MPENDSDSLTRNDFHLIVLLLRKFGGIASSFTDKQVLALVSLINNAIPSSDESDAFSSDGRIYLEETMLSPRVKSLLSELSLQKFYYHFDDGSYGIVCGAIFILGEGKDSEQGEWIAVRWNEDFLDYVHSIKTQGSPYGPDCYSSAPPPPSPESVFGMTKMGFPDLSKYSKN